MYTTLKLSAFSFFPQTNVRILENKLELCVKWRKQALLYSAEAGERTVSRTGNLF